MVFKKMLRAFGVGGPSVDTVLTNPNTRPGLVLEGQVAVIGGDHDVAVEAVAVGLVTRVEVAGADSGRGATVEFHRVVISPAFPLAAGQRRDIPFTFPVPWETPVTDVYGQRLAGMTMGLRTELAIAKAVDKGDLDPVHVHPLPAQERILDAFARLGFRFRSADLEHGRIHGVPQTLPFYQEIEFYPPPQYAAGISAVELTFVADQAGVEVILEFDKRGGLLAPGRDAYGRFRVEHTTADQTDWTAVVEGWLRQAGDRYRGFLAGHPHGPGKSGRGHRSGLGSMAAGAAGGLLGGMILGDALDGDDSGGGWGDGGGGDGGMFDGFGE